MKVLLQFLAAQLELRLRTGRAHLSTARALLHSLLLNKLGLGIRRVEADLTVAGCT